MSFPKRFIISSTYSATEITLSSVSDRGFLIDAVNSRSSSSLLLLVIVVLVVMEVVVMVDPAMQ